MKKIDLYYYGQFNEEGEPLTIEDKLNEVISVVNELVDKLESDVYGTPELDEAIEKMKKHKDTPSDNSDQELRIILNEWRKDNLLSWRNNKYVIDNLVLRIQDYMKK